MYKSLDYTVSEYKALGNPQCLFALNGNCFDSKVL